jgi:hypothetical protein
VEADAIRKLSHQGGHPNIVVVLNLGELNNSPPFFFIDMELCDLTLHTYIHRPKPPSPSESILYFVKNAPAPFKAQQIWNIMRQIADGLKYMHILNMVHRDLKPANGMFLLRKYLHSSVLAQRLVVEIGGLRDYVRGNVANTSLDRRWQGNSWLSSTGTTERRPSLQ